MFYYFNDMECGNYFVLLLCINRKHKTPALRKGAWNATSKKGFNYYPILHYVQKILTIYSLGKNII
jgi:hypothetical protein